MAQATKILKDMKWNPAAMGHPPTPTRMPQIFPLRQKAQNVISGYRSLGQC